MSDRVRVYEVARELGLPNKEVLELLAELGEEVKSHSSSIDGETAELVRDHVVEERRRAAADEKENEERLAGVLGLGAE
ncbi:MAG: translation initiation factor IF-2 N-terminal domain-containing protein, partial [Lentisphaeria bacterium]|nr:translation initiation factor IF-2 N-terminal domain-containing protein [Lentisphaeria bacterium]